MKTFQQSISQKSEVDQLHIEFEPDVLMLFVSPGFEFTTEVLEVLNSKFSTSTIIGCSTSGEIVDTTVNDNTLVLNAIKFEKTEHQLAYVKIADCKDSKEAGKILSDKLFKEDLRHIVIFSDGLKVNGADLVKGLNSTSKKISITGGLAGDGVDFNNTFTIRNGEKTEGEIVGLGLYGDNLKIGYSSKGGWDSFGLERQVTKSEDNVLYELDGQPALRLYKSFLGEKANDLPSSGLLFPLNLRTKEDEQPVVRTILAINEETQSLTFAGSMPEGSYVRLMKANVDRLINGAEASAKDTRLVLEEEADFALLISCVGRRLVLKQLVEEEVEAVRDVLGERPVLTGFYSYGELAPFGEFNPCQLHNQTMTITTFSES